MTTESTSTTGGGNAPTTFDPRPYLRKLDKGGDYLEVKWRLLWLRTDHPEAIITTELLKLDWEAGCAVFHARVEIPGKGAAEGTGSETRAAFPAGWVEKGETVAIGRALGALGYGTQFCTEFEEGHPADSPVERPAPNGTNGTARPHQAAPNGNANRPAPIGSAPLGTGSGLATPAQLKLIYLTATRDAHITEEELEDRCHAQYGRLPVNLTKREASAFIDDLKAAATARTR